jgi:hypothetical protein
MARKGGVQAARMFNRLDLPAIGSYFRQKAQRRPRATPRIQSIAADQVQPGEASRFTPGVERQEMVEGVSMILAIHRVATAWKGGCVGSVSAQHPGSASCFKGDRVVQSAHQAHTHLSNPSESAPRALVI